MQFSNLDLFSYYVSQKTPLSQPQAELYINAGLIRGFIREKDKVIMDDEKIANLDVRNLLSHKPYTIESLSKKLKCSPSDVKKAIDTESLPIFFKGSANGSPTYYLYTDEQIEKLVKDFPAILEKAFEIEKREDEEDGELSFGRQLSQRETTTSATSAEFDSEGPVPAPIFPQIVENEPEKRRTSIEFSHISEREFEKQEFTNFEEGNEKRLREENRLADEKYQEHLKGMTVSNLDNFQDNISMDTLNPSGNYQNYTQNDNFEAFGAALSEESAPSQDDPSQRQTFTNFENDLNRQDSVQTGNTGFESPYRNDFVDIAETYEQNSSNLCFSEGKNQSASLDNGEYGSYGAKLSANESFLDTGEKENERKSQALGSERLGAYCLPSSLDNDLSVPRHSDSVLQYDNISVESVSRVSKLDGKDVKTEVYGTQGMYDVYRNPENFTDATMNLSDGRSIPVNKETMKNTTVRPDTGEIHLSTIDNTEVYSFAGMEGFDSSEYTESINYGEEPGEIFMSGSLQGEESGRTFTSGSLQGEENKTNLKEQSSVNTLYSSGRDMSNVSITAAHSLGQAAYQATFGKTDPAQGVNKIKKYAAPAIAVIFDPARAGTNRMSRAGYRASFTAKNQLGELDQDLKKLGINALVLKKNGKYKKRLSDKDAQYIMFQLEKNFKTADLHGKNLSKLSDGQLKRLERSAVGKDKEILTQYIGFKKLMDSSRGIKGGRMRRVRAFSRLIGTLMEGNELHDGVELILKYTRTGKRAIRTVVMAKRGVQKAARKLIKPVSARYAKKQAKKRVKAKLKQQKKMTRALARKAKTKAIGNSLIKRATGKDIAGLKKTFRKSPVGTGLSRINKRLSPVRMARRKVTGVLGRAFGGTFRVMGRVISLPAKLMRYVFIGAGSALGVLVLITLFAGGVLVVLGMVTNADDETSDAFDNQTVMAASISELTKQDSAWKSTLEELKNISVKEVNGKPIEGSEDPETGKTEKITEFEKVSYYYYDGRAYEYIDDRVGEDFSLSKIKQYETVLMPDSNAKDIISAAHVYDISEGCDPDEFVYYCMFMHDHSHAYHLVVGAPYTCTGCAEIEVSCITRDYDNYTDVSGNDYSSFAYGYSGGCMTYYCNDEESWNEAKYKVDHSGSKDGTSLEFNADNRGCEKLTYSKNFTAYCSFSKHSSSGEPKITDCDGCTDAIKKAYNKNGSYKDAGGGGSDFDDCSYATIRSGKISASDASNLCSSGLVSIETEDGKDGTSSKVTREVDGTTYYVAYCGHLTDVGAKYDGFFLVKKSATIDSTGLVRDGIACDKNGDPMYFYDCQGHNALSRTFYYCPGHKGCSGHTESYCPGHVDLEAYVAVAGLSDAETEDEDVSKCIMGAENLYFGAGYTSYDGNADGVTDFYYSSDWDGYTDDDISIALLVYEEDWKGMYEDIPDDFYQSNIDTPTNSSSSVSISNADVEKIIEQLKEQNDGTDKAWAVIEKGATLVGFTQYSQNTTLNPRTNRAWPEYLDCSSFTAWAFNKALSPDPCNYSDSTDTFRTNSNFLRLTDDSSALKVGDIGEKYTYRPSEESGLSNHVGIYCGMLNGQQVWLHCTSSSGTSLTGNSSGVMIGYYANFAHYWRLDWDKFTIDND